MAGKAGSAVRPNISEEGIARSSELAGLVKGRDLALVIGVSF
jgi:hypothetical protein